MGLRELLIGRARGLVPKGDPSHDINHVLRVLANAEYIASIEGGDLEVIVPGVLFHDVVMYSKNDPRSEFAAEESAVVAREVLLSIPVFDERKIPSVLYAIRSHPFNKGIKPDTLEAQILQDADRLEATGAISIMRTFASSGQMNRPFYNPEAPFQPSANNGYALDLFYNRLLKVASQMNTATARTMAEERTKFLYAFLEQVKKELL